MGDDRRRRACSGPSELGFYAGARDLVTGGPVRRVDRFGEPGRGARWTRSLCLLVVITFVALLMPVGMFVAPRCGPAARSRDRRLAALRLVGADQRMARRIAAGEALVAAACRRRARRACCSSSRAASWTAVAVQGSVCIAADVRPAPLLGVLVVLRRAGGRGARDAGVALRRVVAEPLGVVRRAEASRAAPAVVAARAPARRPGRCCAPTTTQDEDGDQTVPLAVGIIALLVGVAVLLPWLVERVVARLGAGAVAWQLAVRRLQLDPAARRAR